MRKRIIEIWQQFHDLAHLWRWGHRYKRSSEVKRFAALQAWAAHHKQYSWSRSYKAKHHARRLGAAGHHRRAHKAWLHARKWVGQAHHFGHIEKLYRQEKRRIRRRLKHHPESMPSSDLLVWFDGRLVAAWIVHESLEPARRSGLWNGVAFSGFRTPEYSTSLCIAMCGRSTCPGTCAGANSNHSCPPSHTCVQYEGAVDVSDSYGLSRWEGGHGYPTRHTLPNDLPHHSRTGQ